MKTRWLILLAVLFATPALAQPLGEILATPAPSGEGWHGFTDWPFLTNAFFNLVLAAVLGAIIAYHPRHVLTADTFEELEAAQIYILYAVIGSMCGILVVKYGMGVGFVLFGIGARIRFRTVLRSASLTGRLIFVTLIGLSAGLDLPHVAVLVTAFGFGLIYILDWSFTFRIAIRALSAESVAASAAAYRAVLEQVDCRIISEKKNPEKGRVTFILRTKRSDLGTHLDGQFESKVDPALKGFYDWEIG